MSQIKPKGTRDFLPQDTFYIQMIENLFKQVVETNGYREIRTPIFEHTDVYVRSSGEASDIVNKEMYTFMDKGNRSISLRPEGTAGVIRCLVENKLYANADLPLRLYYLGPNFRYERPQAGRYRQFFQFGVENIGIKSPLIDAETIFMAIDMLASAGITNVKLKINSIGDSESRNKYKEALREYFKSYLKDLCEDCQVRFEKNPLRILDCKVDVNHECMKNYPTISSYLSDESKRYFEKVKQILTNLNVQYEVDEKLVRGLDYYNDTVFEITAVSPSGIEYGAIVGGGRYDSLVEQFEGPSLPAFGFGLGLDRANELIKELGILNGYKDGITCYVMPLQEECLDYAFFITNYLRINGVDSEMDYQVRSLKSQFKTVDRKNARFSILIGEDELKNQTVSVRFNKTKEQKIVAYNQLIPYLSETLSGINQGCGCGCEHDNSSCSCGCEHDNSSCCCGEEDCHCGEHEHNGECCCGEGECHCGEHEDGECCCNDGECHCGHHHKEEN